MSTRPNIRLDRACDTLADLDAAMADFSSGLSRLKRVTQTGRVTGELLDAAHGGISDAISDHMDSLLLFAAEHLAEIERTMDTGRAPEDDYEWAAGRVL